ncbi:formimidoylglutamate deiminase [Abyssibacter profundi]|uniref:Formimidoylglutamate deiminase n=1 Tax=Abyssibacter profundi TaxID=2182787 RepID=A0A383XRK8_9GAMM|nr:formimidoylglutamate deiminase [Abyssibacter profundi]
MYIHIVSCRRSHCVSTVEYLHAEHALVEGVWRSRVRVGIDAAGRIASVDCDSPAQPDDQRLTQRVLLPAAANLHSHAFQRAMAGRTEQRHAQRDSFWSWRSQMYRFVERMTPEDLQAIAAYAYMEMLETGFAAVAEFHYLHHGPEGRPYDDPGCMSAAIIAAASEAGIGLTHLPVLYQRGGLADEPVTGGQRRFRSSLDGYAALIGQLQSRWREAPADAVLGVAPHSLRAVDANGLTLAAGLLPGAPVHLHIAEQTAEVEAVQAATGQRPVAYLLDRAEVDAGWCLVHATHLDDAELAGLARSGATVGLAPITEANLGDGLFRAAEAANRGQRWGVGSDSNVRIDLPGELRTLEYGQRLIERRRCVLADARRSTGRWLFDQACAGGAAALGRDCGRLAVGQWADLVTLDTGSIDLCATKGDGWLDAWLFGAARPVVAEVWSAGRPAVVAGRHRRRDALTAAYRQTLQRLTT